MKIVAIFNPGSGSTDLYNLKEELLSRFSTYDFEIMETEYPLHATKLAKYAADKGIDIIIAIGGDGTIMEVASGMINSNSKLGIIPTGTGNMLATNLGIPLNVSKAMELIMEGESKKIDMGEVNDRHFLFMAGCGLDSDIIKELLPHHKKRLGLVAYFIEGFKQAFKQKYVGFKIKLDNKKTIKTKALMVLIANCGNILGDLFSLAPKASMSDGLLDLVIISPRNIFDSFITLFAILTRRTHSKSARIKHYQAKEIEITAQETLAVQADGDIIGETPLNIRVIPEAINIIVPKEITPRHIIDLADEHLKRVVNKVLMYSMN